jgi:hypothetical protein
MNIQTLLNKDVTVESKRGLEPCIVVQILGQILVVCTVEEYERAQLEGRQPYTVGVRPSLICESHMPLDTTGLLKHNVHYEQAEHGEAGPDNQRAGRGE